MVLQQKLNNTPGSAHEYVSMETCRIKILIAADGAVSVEMLSDPDVEAHLLEVAAASSGLQVQGQ